MMSKKQDTPVIEEAPGLGDIEALFPPTSASDVVLLAANVSMKLPVFWPDAAEVWFAQADAQCAIRNVTVSKTKFYHVVAVLPQEVTLQILDLIRAPPAGDPYGVLCKHFILLYSQIISLSPTPFSVPLRRCPPDRHAISPISPSSPVILSTPLAPKML